MSLRAPESVQKLQTAGQPASMDRVSGISKRMASNAGWVNWRKTSGRRRIGHSRCGATTFQKPDGAETAAGDIHDQLQPTHHLPHGVHGLLGRAAALPSFSGTADLPSPQTAWPNPRGYPVDEHVSPPLGFPVLLRSPYACMLSPIPRRNHWVLLPLTSPVMAAFSIFSLDRLPHRPFRGLLGVQSLRPASSQSH